MEPRTAAKTPLSWSNGTGMASLTSLRTRHASYHIVINGGSLTEIDVQHNSSTGCTAVQHRLHSRAALRSAKPAQLNGNQRNSSSSL